MAWDPEIYLRFGAERTRPAAELLSRIMPDKAPEAVADLGCGPGNSTGLLAARWPGAALDGLDSSPEMLDTAAKLPFKARWIRADLSNWQADKSYDVLFANATFQWLDNHAQLLSRLVSFLVPGGTLAFQMPLNFKDPCHLLMRKVATEGPWAEKLRNVRDWSAMREPEEYYDMLSPLCTAIDIWQTRYMQVLEGDDPVFRWMSGTGLRPFSNALSGEEREEFLRRYAAELARAYPRRPDGKTLFPFKRLFIVAKKKAA